MRVFKRLGLLFSGLLISFVLYSFQSSDPLTEKILAFFKKIQEEYPTEKAYLHLDKYTYTLGEDIWFSAYLTAGSNQVPSPLSRTLYVDLFDGEGVLIQQKKVLIENGFGHGDFKLPNFGEEGIYRIKAYTAWMENYGEEYFFHKEIEVFDGGSTSFFPNVDFKEMEVMNDDVKYQVDLNVVDSKGNVLSNQPVIARVFTDGEEKYNNSLNLNSQGEASFSFNIPLEAYKNQVLELTYFENENYSVSKKIKIPYSFLLADVQFMPEGGNMVYGFKSNVAFKGVYPDGSPAEFEGGVMGAEEDIEFSTFFGGMGKFSITPEQGKTYKVRLTEPKTKSFQLIDLPKPINEGLVAQVINNAAANYITVFIQGNQSEKLVLVSQTRGIINYMINGGLTNGIWGVRIPKENLISGINQVTVLTESGVPVLERLFFFQTDDENIQLQALKTGNIDIREQIVLDISSTFGGAPTPGNYSVSITDADQVQSEGGVRGSIFSDLLLTSDLKGQVYLPGYYFKDQEAGTLEALDLVMMTNGWRRFTWDKILEESYPEVERFIERGITIEGTVKDPDNTKRGLRGGKISAIVGNGEELITSQYGPNGRFIFMEMEYLDTAEVTITAEDLRLRNFVDIEIEQPQPFYEKLDPKIASKIKLPKELLASVQERNMMSQMFDGEKIIDLDGVVVEGQTIEKEEEEVRKMYGSGDVSLNPDKILGAMAFTNIFQMIQGRVSGVQVNVSGLNASVLIRGVGSLAGGTEPLYLLDNQPVDAGTLLQVSPRDVSSVDVFKDPAKTAIFGSQGANGVVAVYTKTGASTVNPEVPGKIMTKYGGYAVAKEFYQPNYETKTVENSIPDKRSTIYWNPRLSISENGKAEIKYYNSDIAKKHLVIIEGMDSNGRLARFETILE